jgi:hypothetical protein
MIINDNFEIKDNKVVVKKKILSPCCQCDCYVIGSRRRQYINQAGEHKYIIIRRLRCKNCRRIHHELTSFLVPYKLHCSETIEQVIDAVNCITLLSTPAEYSTIYRIRRWFRKYKAYFQAAIHSNRAKFPIKGQDPQPSIEAIRQGPGWLSRLVQEVANFNLWYRPAFCSSFVRDGI